MSRRNGDRRGPENKKRTSAVLTTNSLNPLAQNYRIGDLAEYQEQSEADSNPLVSLPNRVCSDGKNDYYNVKAESDRNLMTWLAVSPVVHTFRQVNSHNREP